MTLSSTPTTASNSPQKATDWMLVTGQPGCGKTTAVQRCVEFLQQKGVTCGGFYTEEVRDKGARIGFDVVTVPDGRRGVLARKGGPKSWPKTGAYSVDVASFEQLALPSLALHHEDEHGNNNHNQQQKGDYQSKESSSSVVYVLDEIGRMELHSKEFQQHVRKLLQAKVQLVGAVTAPRYGHRVPFCDEVTASPGVQVHPLTKTNRNNVVPEILKELEGRWIESS